MASIDPLTNISQGLLNQGVQSVIGKYNNVNVAQANQFLAAGGANILLAVGTGNMAGVPGAAISAISNLSPGSVTSQVLANIAPGLAPNARQIIANGVMAANQLFGGIINNSLNMNNLSTVSNYSMNQMYISQATNGLPDAPVSPGYQYNQFSEIQKIAYNMNYVTDMIKWTISQGINTNSTAHNPAVIQLINNSSSPASQHAASTTSGSSFTTEINQSTTLPRSYAQDLSDIFPKHNFLFIVVFNLNTDFQKIDKKFTFLVKKCERPDIQIHHELINFYNFRSNVPTKTEFQPVSMNFHDDIMSETMNFFVSYMNQICPIFTQPGQSLYEQNGLTFDSSLTSSYNISSTSVTSVISSIDLYHVYDFGKNVDQFTYMRPQVTKFKLSDLDMADATTCADIHMEFVYDNVYINAGQKADILSSLMPTNMTMGLQYNSTGATDKSGSILPRDANVDYQNSISGNTFELPYSSIPIDPVILSNRTAPMPITTGLATFQNGLTNLAQTQAESLANQASNIASSIIPKDLNGIIPAATNNITDVTNAADISISTTPVTVTSSLLSPIIQQIGSSNGTSANWINA